MAAVKKALKGLPGVAKAVAGAVLPLVSVSLITGAFDWRAIAAAFVTGVVVYFIPNAAPALEAADNQAGAKR